MNGNDVMKSNCFHGVKDLMDTCCVQSETTVFVVGFWSALLSLAQYQTSYDHIFPAEKFRLPALTGLRADWPVRLSVARLFAIM